MEQKKYLTFGLMMLASFIVMYAVMFLNADQYSHVYLSNTRLYMTLLMIAPMALIMLFFMRGMYNNKKANVLIVMASLVIFSAALYFLRSQTFIGDRQYLKAMIPHHSSAILTSQEANLTHPEVKKLAEDIIKAQEREIALMKDLLKTVE